MAMATAAPAARAQGKGFVVQTLIVQNFETTDRDKKLGIRAADAVRERVDDAFNKRELRVVSKNDVRLFLENSGISLETELTEAELKELARHTRADEQVHGKVSRAPGKYRLEARLVLYRDQRLIQPYAAAEAATLDQAADIIVREIVASRKQLGPLRRCENSAREGQYDKAVVAAREGIQAYPRALLSRVCLMTAFAQLGAADSVIKVGVQALEIAPANALALDLIAQSYEAVKDKEKSGDAWMRLLATDSKNEELAERVITALSRLGQTKDAEPLIVQAVADHPENLALLKLEWLVFLANGNWKGAIKAGELLAEKDAVAHEDPSIYARLAMAYRNDSQPQRALATAAVATVRFPKSAEVYVLYAQLVRAEFDIVLPRGEAQFPESAELRVLEAQLLKGAGKLEQSLEATKRALALNPKLPRGFLQLAQMQIDVGQPDSAIGSLRQALVNGEDRALVSQFALARGNFLFKGASATKARDDFLRAQHLLQLADSLAPSPEAKFLIGASALSVSQSAAEDAPKLKSCELSRLASESLNAAEYNLATGGAVSPEAATQYLDFAAKLRPYLEAQVKQLCG